MNNFTSYHLLGLSLSFISGLLVGSCCIYLHYQIKITKIENELENKLINKINELEKKNFDLLKQLMYFGHIPCQSYYRKKLN